MSSSSDTSAADLEIRLPEGRTAFDPRERVEVEVRWWLPEPPREIEVRLVWYTSGRGDQDVSVVDVHHLVGGAGAPAEAVSQQGSRTVSFDLPAEPYSFSGKLITLGWAIELVVDGGNTSTRTDIVVAPGGREVVLAELEEEGDRAALRVGS